MYMYICSHCHNECFVVPVIFEWPWLQNVSCSKKISFRRHRLLLPRPVSRRVTSQRIACDGIFMRESEI